MENRTTDQVHAFTYDWSSKRPHDSVGDGNRAGTWRTAKLGAVSIFDIPSRTNPSFSSQASMEDDMDSLFEGMVLFTPVQLSDPPPPAPPRPQPQPVDPPLPHPPAAASPSSSEPLDENLFSDLTLVTPLPVLPQNGQEEPKLSSSTSIESGVVNGNSIRGREAAPPSMARQVLRKKKRAAGLRIGYGRQEIEHEPPPHPSLSPSPSPVPIDAVSATSSDVRSKQDTSSIDSLNSQSGGSEQDTSHTSVPTVQVDHEPAPSPPLASAETKSEHESIDTGDGNDDPLKDNNDSIEARFDRIKAEISEKLEQAGELVAALSVAKKEATRKRRKAAERMNLASARLKELERSLEEACEAEDFETAERVSESIAGADKEKEALADALRDAEAECDGVDEQMQQVLEAQIAAEEECVSLLKSFSLVNCSTSPLFSGFPMMQMMSFSAFCDLFPEKAYVCGKASDELTLTFWLTELHFSEFTLEETMAISPRTCGCFLVSRNIKC